jgi:hypothetical protein
VPSQHTAGFPLSTQPTSLIILTVRPNAASSSRRVSRCGHGGAIRGRSSGMTCDVRRVDFDRTFATSRSPVSWGLHRIPVERGCPDVCWFSPSSEDAIPGWRRLVTHLAVNQAPTCFQWLSTQAPSIAAWDSVRVRKALSTAVESLLGVSCSHFFDTMERYSHMLMY